MAVAELLESWHVFFTPGPLVRLVEGDDDAAAADDDHDVVDGDHLVDGDNGDTSLLSKIILTFVSFIIGIPNVAGRAVSTVREPSS